MPRRNLSYRSRRVQLAWSIAFGCAMFNSGCRSGIPEAQTWQPSATTVSGNSKYTSSEQIASNESSVSSEQQFLAREPEYTGETTVAETFQAAGLAAVENGRVEMASLLRPAMPFEVQEPEIVNPPIPSPSDNASGNATRQESNNYNAAQDETSPETQAPTERLSDDEDAQTSESDVPSLYLADVVASVRNSYPKIREAIARQAEASGQIVSALGNFDTVLDGHSINQPLGYYENYRQAIGLKQPLWNGGYAGAGYRIGDGYFAPYYEERETNEGGEFKLSLDVPVLQGRAIDKRRTALRTAQLRRGQTEPELFLEILNAQGDAAMAYWTWVAAGLNVDIQTALLELAQDRVEQIEKEIEQGNVPKFRKIDNDRLIASRRIKLIDSERKFGQSAVKLSLYLRDGNGMPLLPPPDAVPNDFPPIPIDSIDEVAIVNAAVEARPETRIFQFDASALRVELAQANNQLLPELNVAVSASQDVGGRTDPKGTRSPAELEAGFYGEVPLQRRMARGKIDSLSAKLRQVEAKLQLARDRIANEVQQILVARETALRQVDQAELNLELARETLRIGDIGLREGEFTLPILNIYEQAVADAEGALLAAKADFFIADALLRVASGQELDVGNGIILPEEVAPLSLEER